VCESASFTAKSFIGVDGRVMLVMFAWMYPQMMLAIRFMR
jgi:hypothetical protein